MEIIKPFSDGLPTWLGNSMGLKRKSYKCINHQMLIQSNSFYVGITVFNPGEGCIVHNHLGAEEVAYIISGGGKVYDASDRLIADLETGDVIFYRSGEYHRNFNDREEPLVMLFALAPHGELPNG